MRVRGASGGFLFVKGNTVVPMPYIYVSDLKVDSLFESIPRNLLKELSVEFNVNLNLIGLSIKRDTPDETRYSKLRIVTSYLEKHGDIGDIESPKAYFKGTLDMAYGKWPEGTVYFAGWPRDDFVLGLGGSLHHIIGSTASLQEMSPSLAPSMISVLAKELKLPDSASNQNDTGFAFRIVAAAADHISKRVLIKQKLEFLALKLMDGKIDDSKAETGTTRKKRVLLGSPVYVRLA